MECEGLRNSRVGSSDSGSHRCSTGEHRGLDSLSGADDRDRPERGQGEQREGKLRSVCVASGMGVDARELDSDSRTQRSVDGTGLSQPFRTLSPMCDACNSQCGVLTFSLIHGIIEM